MHHFLHYVKERLIQCIEIIIFIKDVQEWYREREQTIESALTENTFCDFPLEYEILGESLAIKSDATGFYTTSDWQENAPIYSYHFKC